MRLGYFFITHGYTSFGILPDTSPDGHTDITGGDRDLPLYVRLPEGRNTDTAVVTARLRHGCGVTTTDCSTTAH